MDNEEQHSEACANSEVCAHSEEVNNSEVEKDKAEPAGAESIDGKAAGVENKEYITTKKTEEVDSAPATTPIMIKATNEKTMTKATNEKTPKTKEREKFTFSI